MVMVWAIMMMIVMMGVGLVLMIMMRIYLEISTCLWVLGFDSCHDVLNKFRVTHTHTHTHTE